MEAEAQSSTILLKWYREWGKDKRREANSADRFFYYFLKMMAVFTIIILLLVLLLLVQRSALALHEFGWRFFVTTNWDPVAEQYGVLTFIYGTLVSSLMAILIAGPISIGAALVLNELAPRWIAVPVGFLVEMLAAIPSVVYGLWGIFVLAPWLRSSIQPWLGEHLGFLPFFQGYPFGIGMMAAGVILAIMIMPTISSVCREVFRAVPMSLREGALALGATRWEMLKVSVLATARTGILGAFMMGLGRALGETMAVTMVIGNRPEIFLSWFAPGQTLASVIANEYTEATSDIHLSSLIAVGLSLFLVSLLVNSGARWVVWRMGRHERGARA